jgi:hypothetical protein
VDDLTGRFEVALAPDASWRLFTARGERDWVAGWNPTFPAPVDDDTAVGTVFTTAAHGHQTTWVVVDRDPGRRVRYARVTSHISAGTVTVTLEPSAAGSTVTVTYALTPLSEIGRQELTSFAAGYEPFLAGWAVQIARFLAERDTP